MRMRGLFVLLALQLVLAVDSDLITDADMKFCSDLFESALPGDGLPTFDGNATEVVNPPPQVKS